MYVKTLFKKKYFSVGIAAKFVGVSRNTMFRWAQKGKTSDDVALDVVRDTVTMQYWISEECLMFLATEYQRKRALSESQRFMVIHK